MILTLAVRVERRLDLPTAHPTTGLRPKALILAEAGQGERWVVNNLGVRPRTVELP